MKAVPADYSGREQTFIKHSFLTQYLRSAAYKILQGRSSVFNYVDAFAGPWQLADEDDCSDASFHQAVEILESVRSDLVRQGRAGLRVQSFFCEKRAGAASRLREYAREHKNLEIRVFEGAFEDHLAEIEAGCRGGFTFTFVDPTGWNIRSAPIFRFLARLDGEFLLNFMAEHINRHAGYSGVTESIGRFLADPEWKDDFAALTPTDSHEIRVLTLLKRKMKEMNAAKFLPDIAIKRPKKEGIKMRLILGTRSPAGVEVFRDVQSTVEKKEMEIRTDLMRGTSHRMLLFPSSQLADIEQKRDGVGGSSNLRRAERTVIDALSERDGQMFGDLGLATMEGTPIRKTQMKKLLLELKERAVVTFDLPEKARVPREQTRIWLARGC